MNWDKGGRDGHSNFIRWVIVLCVIGLAGAAAVIIFILIPDRTFSSADSKSAQAAALASGSGESMLEASDFLESIPEEDSVSELAGSDHSTNSAGSADPGNSELSGSDVSLQGETGERAGNSSSGIGQSSEVQNDQSSAADGADAYTDQGGEAGEEAGSTDESDAESGEEASSEASTAEAVRQTATVERTLYFLGDSRTVGMYRAVTGRNNVTDGTVFDKDSNYFGWAASNGQGLAWAKSTGASFIDSSVGSGCAVVVLLGVNDVTGGEAEEQAYVDYLNTKAEQWKGMGGVETFWVSINPVGGTINGIDNTKIEDFNQTVRSGLSDDVWYLDTYYELSGQFDTVDRLHYTDETYQKIYDRILQDVMIRYADDGVPVSVEGR